MTEGGHSYMTDDRLDDIIKSIDFAMDNFKKYREDAVERSNIVDSVINEAKEVAQRHFASSEYSVMTAEKLQHERDRDEKGVLNLLDGYKAHLVSTLKAACESVFSIDDELSNTLFLTLCWLAL